jgi:hypothetical protein
MSYVMQGRHGLILYTLAFSLVLPVLYSKLYGGVSVTDFKKEIRAPLSIISVHHTKHMNTIIV